MGARKSKKKLSLREEEEEGSRQERGMTIKMWDVRSNDGDDGGDDRSCH